MTEQQISNLACALYEKGFLSKTAEPRDVKDVIRQNVDRTITDRELDASDVKAVPVHPVQKNMNPFRGYVPQVVTRLAYQVYYHVFGEQPAIITGNCRGGFGVGELIAFLYAWGFPRSEWSKRVDEALKGMRNV